MSKDTDDFGIVVNDIARSFGAVHAVRSASLVAKRGEVTALIGPNGSGKTTLMLMLASLLAPDRGTIRINGHDPATDPAAVRRSLGWMPDILGSWASLTVRTTLEITARLYDFDKDAARARAAELITQLGLQNLADQPTRVLSRGQKQSLSLARSLVHSPSVLLLDEPASGLDPGARVRLRELVRSLAADGTTILISSHVLSELDELADSAVYIDAGVTASTEVVAQTMQSKRPWRIKALDSAKLRTALAKNGFDDAAITAERTELLVDIVGEDDAAKLLTALVKSGVAISSFTPAVGEIEHVFMDLSKGARR